MKALVLISMIAAIAAGAATAAPPQPINGCPPGVEVCIPEWAMDCKQHQDGWITPSCWKSRKP